MNKHSYSRNPLPSGRTAYCCRLAADNMKKNSKTYIPYLLTCIGTIAMFYIINFVNANTGISQIKGGDSLRLVLSFGCAIIGLFAVLFLLYTNSFLIKRRKKEFGLFHILGMEKKHVGGILFFEVLYTAVISLVLGLLSGYLFAKLTALLLLRLMDVPIVWDFGFSLSAAILCPKLFGVIFVLILCNNLFQIYKSSPIELLHGGETGEREPKAKWLMAAAGLICLIAAYRMALTASTPSSAITSFFFAVILVMFGTYFLFTAGSIVVLKLLRRNKAFYYQTRHFISISGMMYRMKQNAAGLTCICILSCAVLVMLSSTVTLYVGLDDVLKNRYPRDMIISSRSYEEESTQAITNVVSTTLAEQGLQAENYLSYRYISFAARQDGSHFDTMIDNIQNYNLMRLLYFIPVEDYNRLAGDNAVLGGQEALVFYNRTPYNDTTLSIFGREFQVKPSGTADFISGGDAMVSVDCYFIVVSDMAVLEEMNQQQAAAYGINKSTPTFYAAFDLNADPDTQIHIRSLLSQRLGEVQFSGYLNSRVEGRGNLYALYAGLFFLGIFLGLLFIMATVLIIYYKQISEGYDDKARFEIMQKVGLSQKEIKGAIHSQILLMFFLPLVTAGVHIAFAFPLIVQLLSAMNLTNVPLFAWCTFGTLLVFALLYALVFGMTSKVYYQIVKR